MIVLYLNICWGNVHYLSVLQDKRFRESDGIVVITIFFMDERFCAFVLLLSICCVNNAFFIMLQYIWDILYRESQKTFGSVFQPYHQASKCRKICFSLILVRVSLFSTSFDRVGLSKKL